MMEREAGEEGMGYIGEDYTKGKFLLQGGGKLLQGGDTHRALIWIRFFGHVDDN